MPNHHPEPEGGSPILLAQELRSAAKRAHKRAERKKEKLTADLAACGQVESVRHQAELLKAAMPTLKRGLKEAVVQDYYSATPNATVTIPLDPAHHPRETMEKLFHKAAKLERAKDEIAREISLNEDRCGNLAQLLDRIDKWLAPTPQAAQPGKAEGGDPALLLPLFDEAKRLRVEIPSGVAPPPSATAKPLGKREKEIQRMMSGMRIFASHDGIEILVGKSDIDNDTLSCRLAKGNDWWFHLAPAPGSHVVARNPGRPDLPQETMLDAAHLAIYYSKMRGATRADVHYTQAKHVRRVKGGHPGLVQLERSQTISIRMEPERLERLLRPELNAVEKNSKKRG